MLDILIFHNILHNHYKNRFFVELQKKAQQSGLKVKVVHFSSNESSRDFSTTDDDAFAYDYEVMNEKYEEEILPIFLIKKSITILQKYRPKVVNLTGYYSIVHFFILLFCKWKGIKVVLSSETTIKDNQQKGWKLYLKRFFVKSSDGYFCFGKSSVDYLKYLGGKEERIFARRNAAVDNDFIEQEAQKTQKKSTYPPHCFIFVGRLLPIKNVEGLIKAFQNLKNANDWGLLLVGDGVEKETLEHLVKKENIERVFFVGGKMWNEVPHFLAQADVLVLPSFSEPWGLVVNEAMAASMPVVVSDRCGCSEDLLLPNENGIVFSPEKQNELNDALQFFVDKPHKIAEYGKKSQEIIRDWTIQKAAKDSLNGFKTLCLAN